MDDFDLSQALDNPLESDEKEVDSRCFDMTGILSARFCFFPSWRRQCDSDVKKHLQVNTMRSLGRPPPPLLCLVQEVHSEIVKLDAGLDLVVSRNPYTMKGVATLLLAANRLKGPLTREGRELRDDELCQRIVDSVIESECCQRTVLGGTRIIACSFQMRFPTIIETAENSSTGRGRIIFKRLRSWECNLTDDENKDIVCTTKDLKLESVTLKGGNGNHKVTFKLGTYFSPGVGQTVVLSIINHNLYISCTMNGNKAEMKLEKCSADQLKSITADGNMDRFLFYNKQRGMNGYMFESVMCSGWFISTSYEKENHPVEMCKVDTACRVFTFSIY
ncbi:Interleukin 1 beta like 1 [Scophthalmus maximus]|uniref:Interleukin-1 n=1 Tax=Scophthalmus maximus TaxID=52904 RepID=A0A2U9B9W9_SCOMX|nr:Interleukin 1 beta like 1 [Scophthalmus maximus]